MIKSKSKKILSVIKRPVETFIQLEAASGIVLGLCAILAMYLANGTFAQDYFAILNFPILNLSVQLWINDALMAIFFFVVGMEIKKELVVGELNSPKKAALPIAAAIGGMVFPALIYFANNPSSPEIKGWGIPMATDIAFAIGVLTLFGKRIPLALKVFLLAIAIVDDLGAILVIAFFYTSQIKGYGLAIAALSFVFMFLMRTIGIRSYLFYFLIGALAWFGVLQSGVHATIAGVIAGLMTPFKFPVGKHSHETYSPLEYLVKHLHPWVSFGIMPLFALANAGVAISGVDFSSLYSNSVFKGIAVGLVVGKPLGVVLFSFLSVKIGIAALPKELNWNQVIGVGLLAGIGFTMSLFISALALTPQEEIYSKTGIITGSVISAIIGAAYLLVILRGSAGKSIP